MCVRIGQKLGMKIKVYVGLRQGCVMPHSSSIPIFIGGAVRQENASVLE
jgi:hypothetical protein